ncbi:MAG: hypothetical protein IT210_04705, partial [Armatimonadetes bacterium]|nr:hypothetical protein [Armatimonadota bacterium]
MARSSDSEFASLLSIKGDRCLRFARPDAALAVCPDMGGRVFAEVLGLSMHRIDLDCVSNPTRPFNNFGGGNFWPAPEGGKFGFNYCQDEWIVQKAINNEPFQVAQTGKNSACIEKRIVLANRAGTAIETTMRREVDILDELPRALRQCPIAGWLSYRTTDSFDVLSTVNVNEGLIAAWTLEQFDATQHTVAFCAVENPCEAINFDFYEHPGDRIAYFDKGFTYKTDGLKRGQIGIKKAAGA